MDSNPTTIANPNNPMSIPRNCSHWNLNLSQITENNKANNGVLPFITAMVFALISFAAYANK
jgi:hypothetical protein